MIVAVLVALAFWGGYRRQASKRVGPGLRLVSLGFYADNRVGLRAVFVPDDKLSADRNSFRFDQVTLDGRIWPPLSDCSAEVSGFSMNSAAMRPAAALSALFELRGTAGFTCGTLRFVSGAIFLGDTPPIRLDLEEALWSASDSSVMLKIGRLDGQPTRLRINAENSEGIRATGKWELTGLDVTALLARMGLTWPSKTDIGFMEFEIGGTEREESGRLRISSWVLLGKSPSRPFRISAPNLMAEFTASDGMVLFQHVHVERPSYDLIGANPDFYKNIFSTSPLLNMRPPKQDEANPGVSGRRQSRVRHATVPAEAFAVRVLNIRIDTGAAFVIDRPERTRFALKFADVTVDMSGPASILGQTPNTSIRFRANDKKEMHWKAITDFSTWPPQFRLTDVR